MRLASSSQNVRQQVPNPNAPAIAAGRGTRTRASPVTVSTTAISGMRYLTSYRALGENPAMP
jgi:hypothetical protein